MRTAELLVHAYDRVHGGVHRSLDGLGPEHLHRRPGPATNPIGWLAWHLLRVQDDHLSDVAGHEQAWTAQGWAGSFGLPFEAGATGYGFDAEQVAAVRIPSVDLLTGYADDVHARSVDFLRGLSDADLDRVVDTSWDPPVTLGVRLVSVLSDDLEHLGQIGYVRGLLGA
ncbi:DinB family protein [Blastococcus sp. HT6-30]|uniref:mycothiol transferase n=1 Tax=Blastococcus sp. HT6-30 TaxID=3144843 RepID=UPI00321BADDA